MEEEIDDNDIPESMWTRGFYSGTLSGGGKSYNISVAISFPGRESQVALLSALTNTKDIVI